MVSLQKAALIPGGSDSLVYTTLSGLCYFNIFVIYAFSLNNGSRMCGFQQKSDSSNKVLSCAPT